MSAARRGGAVTGRDVGAARARWCVVVAALAASACAGDASEGAADAGASDARPSDAGLSDAGAADAGPSDSGAADAGCPPAPGAEVIACHEFWPRDLAIAGAHVYWTGYTGEIRRAPIAGGAVETLSGGHGEQYQILLDAQAAYLYERNAGSRGVVAIDLATGGVRVLAPRERGFFRAAMDADALYWTGGSGILRFAKDGSSTATVAGTTTAAALMVDGADLYWTAVARTATATLFTVPTAGGAPRAIASVRTAIPPFDVTPFASDATHVYWADLSCTYPTGRPHECTSTVRRAPKTGGAPETLGAGDKAVRSILPLGAALYVLWEDRLERRDGATVTVVSSGFAGSGGLTATPTHLYWVDSGAGSDAIGFEGRVLRAPR